MTFGQQIHRRLSTIRAIGEEFEWSVGALSAVGLLTGMDDRFRWPHRLEHNPLIGSQTNNALQNSHNLFETAVDIAFPIRCFYDLKRWFYT